MTLRLYTPVYALTLLISAALLFSVQPMFSKMILPLLGGTPQVWNTAMLFFQLCLLGGYAYAHGTSRLLSMRMQAGVHVILLAVFIFVLPFGIPEGWSPPVDKDPTIWQLSLMAMTVGGPFFVLAGSAPMLQRWFAGSEHPDAHNPYFLYGASNLGSMSSLLLYPVLFEPLMKLSEQSDTWMYGYFLLISLTVFSALLIWRSQKAGESPKAAKSGGEPVTWAQRFSWIFLAFVPSSLMLGVTTFITTDISSVPLLWIIPLAIYVGTFILVFARKPLLSEKVLRLCFDVLLAGLILQNIITFFTSIDPLPLIALHMALFFFAAMVCHTALANSRPHASHLTEFYLLMSVGGALGGFFNAIIAPQFLILPIEYGIVLGLAVLTRFYLDEPHSLKNFIEGTLASFKKEGLNTVFTRNGIIIIAIAILGIFAFGLPSQNVLTFSACAIAVLLLLVRNTRWHFGFGVILTLLLFPLGFHWGQHNFTNIIHQDRNFFGVIRVIDTVDEERVLMHGTTNHGAQALSEEHKMTPLSYYSPSSPINDVFSYFDGRGGKQQFGVLGLGIGVTACFDKKDRHFDFYEIDPDIADVAVNEEYFTYMSDCGSPYEIILGDGRLTLQDKPEDHYDLLVLDAFSSDNIPVHLVTKEAVEIYLSKIKENGVVIFNVSNNYIDLEPVLSLIAEELDVHYLADLSDGGTIPGTDLAYYPAHFFVMTRSDRVKRYLEGKDWSAGMKREGVKVWSDQYSNILSVLGNKIAIERFKLKMGDEKGEDEETSGDQG